MLRLPLKRHAHYPGYVLHSFIIKRNAAGIVARIATKLLRLRYLALGAGVGGTYTFAKKYEDFKDSLPDTSFIRNYFPDIDGDLLKSIKASIGSANESTKEAFSRLKSKFSGNSKALKNGNKNGSVSAHTDILEDLEQQDKEDSSEKTKSSATKERKRHITIEELQEALLKKELEYHKHVENLMQENRSLRSELLLKSQRPSQRGRIKRSLIDMYSEVLDELSDLDSAYNAQDQLPRVVVVGDQSSGKTSVLEMIAQARIFPRGSGEMMTRSPVQVTLSEGPYHVASFKDSPREYDLTKESELATLRKDIETRMKALVSGGKTISSEVISLNVKGPGLQRIVLVDLPGIISTETSGMAKNTRETIQAMAKHYMVNPNAIILCIQDGSIDAERSNVTDLVSSVDPQGKRTIFVLTKVDLAESTMYNPNRIKEILAGKLFPMKALGYYAVVTGRGSKDESIESIRAYEEEFFSRSRLFREGALRLSQMTTANLSKAVSERFWNMVKDSIEQQADTYRALRYNLEAEWKNSFSHLREMDREELFEKARNEILDDLITLNGISADTWEKSIYNELWTELQDHVFAHIFEPAQQIEDLRSYQTTIDIWFRDWVEKELPKSAIHAGWTTLYQQLDTKLKAFSKAPNHDSIFDQLKHAVHEETRKRHSWDSKAENRLRVIQSNALDDRTVHTKTQWMGAVEFLDQSLKSRLKAVNESIAELCGPGWIQRWTLWRSQSAEQKLRQSVALEVETLLATYSKPNPHITPDDLTTVRRNLQARNITVTDALISETWEPLVRRWYLERALYTCHECRKSFYHYQQGFLSSSSSPRTTKPNGQTSDLHSAQSTPTVEQEDYVTASDPLTSEFADCREVIFFYRLKRMLEATSNALRQQIMNDEARRLESHVKHVLSDIGEDPIRLRKLLTGRRVQLAEQLKRTRHIQEKLEEFITALNKDD